MCHGYRGSLYKVIQRKQNHEDAIEAFKKYATSFSDGSIGIDTTVFDDPTEDGNDYGGDDKGMVSDIDVIEGTESIISDKTKIQHKKNRQGTNHGEHTHRSNLLSRSICIWSLGRWERTVIPSRSLEFSTHPIVNLLQYLLSPSRD